MTRFACLALLPLLWGAAAVTPAPLLPEADECAHCRMSVENEHLAAQLIAADGAALKFDELGCMVDFVKAKGRAWPKPRAIFVKDFKTTSWLPLERATLVKSTYPTPMRHGLLAFSSLAAAKALDVKHHGRPTSWRALVEGK